MRPRFFAGFHRCLPALADTGNDLIVEHVIEFPAWRDELSRLWRTWTSSSSVCTATSTNWTVESAPAVTAASAKAAAMSKKI
jgi:hypothetical protein